MLPPPQPPRRVAADRQPEMRARTAGKKNNQSSRILLMFGFSRYTWQPSHARLPDVFKQRVCKNFCSSNNSGATYYKNINDVIHAPYVFFSP
jgi:hypothetical protein